MYVCMLTLLDETFTDLLKLMQRTGTPHLLLLTVTVSYIKGTSETISRILQPYNIHVAHKPTTTLQHLLTNIKDKTNSVPQSKTLNLFSNSPENFFLSYVTLFKTCQFTSSSAGFHELCASSPTLVSFKKSVQ